jgi:hypothetical protein
MHKNVDSLIRRFSPSAQFIVPSWFCQMIQKCIYPPSEATLLLSDPSAHVLSFSERVPQQK